MVLYYASSYRGIPPEKERLVAEEIILKERARAGIGHNTYRVKLVGNEAYVEWGGWSHVGHARTGTAAIKQAEAFLANRR